jgi:hypothetical protein
MQVAPLPRRHPERSEGSAVRPLKICPTIKSFPVFIQALANIRPQSKPPGMTLMKVKRSWFRKKRPTQPTHPGTIPPHIRLNLDNPDKTGQLLTLTGIKFARFKNDGKKNSQTRHAGADTPGL